MAERLKQAAIAGTALAVGAAATAGADQMIGGEDIRDGSIKLKDLSDGAQQALKGNRGPRGRRGRTGKAGPAGPAGPEGKTGPQCPSGASGASGADGADGTAGAPASGAFLLGGSSKLRSPSKVAAPDFAPVIGGRPLRNQQGDVQIPAPDDITAARGLRVRLSEPVPWDVTVELYVNGTASPALTCEVVSPATTCDALADSQPVAAGDLLALGITSEGKGKGGKGKGKGGGPTLNFSLALE